MSGNYFLETTRMEIKRQDLIENIKVIKQAIQPKEILGVVKANATGHGLLLMSQLFIQQGIKRLAVTTVEEAVYLRQHKISVPILILGTALPSQAQKIVTYDLTVTISSDELIRSISDKAREMNKIIKLHLKVDTGLHRYGILPTDALDFCKKWYHLPNIEWEGIYSHFSNADIADWQTTDKQYDLFTETVDQLTDHGFTFELKHIGGSATIFRKKYHLDMVRVGIGLFGYSPVDNENFKHLKPVLTIKTEISHIKTLSPGESIGYGGHYVTSATEKIALIPLGHSNGYKRGYAKDGYVLIRGQKAPIISAISLDQALLDVTHIDDVTVGDEVVVLGDQNEQLLDAFELAEWIDSSVDEVLGSWSDRLPRVLV